MTIDQQRSIAIQDGARKILSGEFHTPSEYFHYFVDASLFVSATEYSALVWERVSLLQIGK